MTKDLKKIQNFCDNWEVQGGGDAPEDWAGGYEIALYKINWRNGIRIIVHICDSPAHGAKFSKYCDDNHKEEYYEKKLEDLIKKCADDNIRVVGIYKTDGAKFMKIIMKFLLKCKNMTQIIKKV